MCIDNNFAWGFWGIDRKGSVQATSSTHDLFSKEAHGYARIPAFSLIKMAIRTLNLDPVVDIHESPIWNYGGLSV